eukprot:TRINITY_DN3153_c0_g1_i6.p1 TRINITY_DN3153_c0_g1~~TRINITY_DN3153_c0_g1_i6.p1  ORF type:complete len:260 (+),score=52.02 TRINITY_DN3153_c0_g1_i6:112-780(+)
MDADGGGNDEPACFPAAATVDGGSRGAVRMEDLRVGDAVASAAVGGAPTDVFLFTHADAGAVARFVQLTTAGGLSPLVVSPGHYVHLAGGRTAAARTVTVGDALVAAASGAAAPVTAVAAVTARGLYNPQRSAGTWPWMGTPSRRTRRPCRLRLPRRRSRPCGQCMRRGGRGSGGGLHAGGVAPRGRAAPVGAGQLVRGGGAGSGRWFLRSWARRRWPVVTG